MTESMIERVSAAVDGELKRLGLLQNISVGNVIARAAIEAMREPTDAMIDAACGARVRLYPAWEGQKPQPTAGEVIIAGHHAMIDAALQWPPGSADRAGVPLAKD